MDARRDPEPEAERGVDAGDRPNRQSMFESRREAARHQAIIDRGCGGRDERGARGVVANESPQAARFELHRPVDGTRMMDQVADRGVAQARAATAPRFLAPDPLARRIRRGGRAARAPLAFGHDDRARCEARDAARDECAQAERERAHHAMASRAACARC
ncbi:MAG TPA: hypothetical protein VIZ64_01260 [Dokdonella sp.]